MKRRRRRSTRRRKRKYCVRAQVNGEIRAQQKSLLNSISILFYSILIVSSDLRNMKALCVHNGESKCKSESKQRYERNFTLFFFLSLLSTHSAEVSFCCRQFHISFVVHFFIIIIIIIVQLAFFPFVNISENFFRLFLLHSFVIFFYFSLLLLLLEEQKWSP